MTDYERLEERCNYAEAKCQQLQEQLEEMTELALDAALLLMKALPVEEPEIVVMIVG